MELDSDLHNVSRLSQDLQMIIAKDEGECVLFKSAMGSEFPSFCVGRLLGARFRPLQVNERYPYPLLTTSKIRHVRIVQDNRMFLYCKALKDYQRVR